MKRGLRLVVMLLSLGAIDALSGESLASHCGPGGGCSADFVDLSGDPFPDGIVSFADAVWFTTNCYSSYGYRQYTGDERCDVNCDGQFNGCDVEIARLMFTYASNDPSYCQQVTCGACCTTDSSGTGCSVETEANCLEAGGTYYGDGMYCESVAAVPVTEPGGCVFTHFVSSGSRCPDSVSAPSMASLSASESQASGPPYLDGWVSDSTAVMCHNFSGACPGSSQIPAGFFGPGSDPFTGQACLRGAPLGGLYGNMDTIIEREQDPFSRCELPGADSVTVLIQILELSLVSINPITVTYNGGASSENWDVAVDLSSDPSPPGTLTARKTHCNGGTYTSSLPVLPRFTFTKVGDPGQVRVLDTGLEDIDPIVLDQQNSLPWATDIGVFEGQLSPDSDFHPGFEAATQETECDDDTNGIHDDCPGAFTVGDSLVGVFNSASAWGDYDNDGDLDILLTGETESGPISRVYGNVSGTFTDIGAALEGVYGSSVAWGDYDNDSDLDIALTGLTDSGHATRVYRNDNGGFADVAAGLVDVFNSSVAWGDYDNDGDLDLLLTGDTSYSSDIGMSFIYRNESGTFVDVGAAIPDLYLSSVAWGDYDKDGDLDILLAGFESPSNSRISRVYRNTGGSFADVGASLLGVGESSVAWGDYDSDGDLDILLAGNSNSGAAARVYRNDPGAFVDIGAALTGVWDCSGAWGDYDNDGDLDIVLTGYPGSGGHSAVYRNDVGSFHEIDAGIPPTTYGNSVAWGDYDNDGDLDILLTGGIPTPVARIYRNDGLALANVPPSAPTSPGFSLGGGLATFSWTASSDAKTPTPGLTYNLRIGTTPGGSEVMPPMAAGNGYRRVPRLGNVNHRLSWAIPTASLPAGLLHWSVQAIDGAFAGSAFPAEVTSSPAPDTLRIAGAAPTVYEGEGTYEFQVVRSAMAPGSVQVHVAFTPGSATPGEDYGASNTVLSFAQGDTNPQTVQVSILDDAYLEYGEGFTVSLSIVSGFAVAGPPLNCFILDNDDGGVPDPNAPKIALHVASRVTGKKVPPPCDNTSTMPSACVAANVQGNLMTDYYVYLLVTGVPSAEGIAGAQFGITYDADRIQPWFSSFWNLCADMEYPGSSGPGGIPEAVSGGSSGRRVQRLNDYPYPIWPAPGSGNTITWATRSNCQRNEPGGAGTGVVAVGGWFSVYGYYYPSALVVTPRPEDGLARVATCPPDGVTVGVYEVPEENLGSAGFGMVGCNPCQPTSLPPPENCAAVMSGTKVTLTWDDGPAEAYYNIFRDGELLTAVPQDVTSFEDESGNVNATYEVQAATRCAVSTKCGSVVLGLPKEPGELPGLRPLVQSNPSGSPVRISFESPDATSVDLVIHDIAGRSVRKLLGQASLPAGRHEAHWDGTDEAGRRVPSGIYLLRFRAANQVRTERFVLLR